MSVEDIIFLMRKDKVGFINSNCCDVCKIDTQLQLHTLRIEHGSVEIPSFSSHVEIYLMCECSSLMEGRREIFLL